MSLQIAWFGLIVILWLGYFFLEGFDFGVGILLPFLARNDTERRVIINTIGPVWDGNEVWLVTAGGATFAAFPDWYATLFSGFYLALLLILVALIVRGVAFEFRGKSSSPRWRRWWDRALFFGSAVPALLWGVAFANFVGGVPIDGHKQFTGTLLDLLGPYALLGGVTFLLLFTLHGAVYLVLKTEAEMAERARRIAQRLGNFVVPPLVLAFLAWSYYNAVSRHDRGVVPDAIPIMALGATLTVGWLLSARLDFAAFMATGASIVLLVLTLFLNLYPRVLISNINPDYSLTIANSSSSQYTLTVMTIIAAIFVPFVVLYQGWAYYVFRKRVGPSSVGGGH
jgi:cytochrome bd ubiquinol oxidase subunit II